MGAAAIRLRTPEGEWRTVGTQDARGITAESLTMAADEQGPSSCGFLLRRDPGVQWGDLAAANQVEVEVAGPVVWGGRLNQTPGQGRAATAQITVQAEGWRSHLDDDQLDMGWVHNKTTDWIDQRDFLGHRPVNFRRFGVPGSSDGIVMIGWPIGNLIVGDAVGVTFDAGPTRRIAKIVFDWATSGGTAGVPVGVYVRGHSTDDALLAANDPPQLDGQSLFGFWGAGPGTSAGTFPTPSRYVSMFLWSTTAVASPAEQWMRFSNVKLFSTTDVDGFSGSAPFGPLLKASNVVRAVLSSGAVPLLSSDTSRIEATSFVIPEYWPDGYRTPRELVGGVNAFHDYLLGVDAERRLFFKSRSASAAFETGAWSGDAFSDASMNNLADLYNKVIVEYTGPDGTPSAVIRTNPSSILTRQGLTRAKRYPVQAVLTAPAANQIGDIWLAKHATAPLSGSITVRPGDMRTVGGVEVHPSLLLTKMGQRVTLTERVDPVTGAVGRVGTMVSCTYNDDTEEAQVQIDNDTGSLEGWLSRLAVVQGAG